MIVREIVTNPELIDNFDWFNDYEDTRLYLKEVKSDLIKRFDEAYRLFCQTRTINMMSQLEMCRLHRRAPSGHPYFDSSNPISKVWEEEFKKKGGFTPEISKQIGWDQ